MSDFNATFVGRLSAAAAHIAATGNGLPRPEFADLATHVLANLVGYRPTNPYKAQDIDYLARILQAAYAYSCSEGDK